MLPPDHAGDWHFCRGMYNTEQQTFKSYAEFGGCYQGGFGQVCWVRLGWVRTALVS